VRQLLGQAGRLAAVVGILPGDEFALRRAEA